MKLVLYPVLLVAAELALFAGLGQAYWEDDIYDLSARDLGFDAVTGYYAREYDPKHYARDLAEPDLTSIATRELVEELEGRLNFDRRDTNIAAVQQELEKLLAVPHKTNTQKNRIKKLKKKLRKHSSKSSGGTSGAHDHLNAGAAAMPLADSTTGSPLPDTNAGTPVGGAAAGAPSPDLAAQPGTDTPVPAPAPVTPRR